MDFGASLWWAAIVGSRLGGLGAAVLVACLLAAAGTARDAAPAAPKLLVGVDDNTALWLSRPNGLVAAERGLGLRAVRLMVRWHRGETIPSREQQTALRRVALTAALGQRVVLSVYGTAADAPTDAAGRAAYCHFFGHVVRRIPIVDVVVWNEANNPYFWPAGDAASYEQLLARCWDVLHQVRRRVNVIDSTAPHQDPAAFLLALGQAYRESGRTRPILDTFGHNVYPESSGERPWATHDNGSIDEGDYDRLVAVLSTAFAGTAQPLPGDGRPRIWYLEDGFQTAPPPQKERLYSGSETERDTLAPAADTATGATGATAAPDQATQLRDAIELAYCQPDVGAFFNFQLIDDHSLAGWQSGLLWSDGTVKPAAAIVRQTIDQLASGGVDCTAVSGP
jgi:hypothetical protein